MRPGRSSRRNPKAPLHAPAPITPDQHSGPDRHAAVEVRDVLVQHADAAARDLIANSPGLVRAVNAEQDVAAVLIQVERTGAEGVVEPALLEARQVGFQTNHRGGRPPIGPDRLAAHYGCAFPRESLFAHADAVAHRRAVALDEVEEAIASISTTIVPGRSPPRYG